MTKKWLSTKYWWLYSITKFCSSDLEMEDNLDKASHFFNQNTWWWGWIINPWFSNLHNACDVYGIGAKSINAALITA